MRWLLCIFLSLTALNASSSHQLYRYYQAGDYTRACDEGIKKLGQYKEDEKYVSIYAFACLQADKIDRLALPIIMLNNSNEARKNAAYFSVILMQKMLLLSSLENREPLQNLKLPTTEYILSKVFDLYSNDRGIHVQGKWVFTDPKNPRQTYRLYLQKSGSRPMIIVEEYYDTILTKRHTYR